MYVHIHIHVYQEICYRDVTLRNCGNWANGLWKAVLRSDAGARGRSRQGREDAGKSGAQGSAEELEPLNEQDPTRWTELLRVLVASGL